MAGADDAEGAVRELVNGEGALVRSDMNPAPVQVETADGRSRVGKVKSVTDDELRIGKDEVILQRDVQRVRLRSSGHHGRNALIGLGVGAGIGAGFAVGSCGGKGAWFSRGQCAAVSAPLFGGLGAAIGALLPSRGKWLDLYQVK
jgi:hypothetical protein